MRIAVLSDTHLPSRTSSLPGGVYEAVADSDLVIHAGDCVEEAVIRDLERLAPVQAVSGNMDDPCLSERLPSRLELTLEGFRVCVAHGWGPPWGLTDRVLSLFETPPDILVYGHSHEWHLERRGGMLILNPGSTCGPRGKRSMALLTLERGRDPVVERIAL
ncbi:metallophosphoesterase [Candidatus Fermentibacteria bacterium]|nr:metallophosphoesterase [Candidatus Fermentibacteria bacterium]